MKLSTLKTGLTAAILFVVMLAAEVNAMAGPPPWAPAHGYRAKTRYVYFPHQNIYYDLKKNLYIYPQGASWIFGGNLPSAYSGVNLNGARQVELYYYANNPEKYNKQHKAKYYKVKNPNKVKMKAKPSYQHKENSNHKNGKGSGKK